MVIKYKISRLARVAWCCREQGDNAREGNLNNVYLHAIIRISRRIIDQNLECQLLVSHNHKRFKCEKQNAYPLRAHSRSALTLDSILEVN